MVGIDRRVRVDQINFQAASSLAGVGQSLGQWIAWQQALRLELLVDPCEELLGDRLGVHKSIVEFSGRAELLLADAILAPQTTPHHEIPFAKVRGRFCRNPKTHAAVLSPKKSGGFEINGG